MRPTKNLFKIGGTKKAIELKGWGKIRWRSVGVEYLGEDSATIE